MLHIFFRLTDIYVIFVLLNDSEMDTPFVYDNHVTGKNFVGRLSNILRESVNHVDSAENIVVVKTLSGVASAAAAAIDSMEHASIVGTLAGDDTILIVMRSKGSAETFRKEIETLL